MAVPSYLEAVASHLVIANLSNHPLTALGVCAELSHLAQSGNIPQTRGPV